MKKSPGPVGYTGDFYQTPKKVTSILLKHFQKSKRKEHFQTIILIPKADKDPTRKENQRQYP